jgi:hypothetical protein
VQRLPIQTRLNNPSHGVVIQDLIVYDNQDGFVRIV